MSASGCTIKQRRKSQRSREQATAKAVSLVLSKLILSIPWAIVKSSHLYLYSAFNNTNCDKATAQYQNGKIESIM